MNAIVFLLVFVVLSVVGGFMLWLRERGPRSMEAHIREFERQREALSPGAPPKRRRTAVPAPDRDQPAG
jgi:hypothetical protein